MQTRVICVPVALQRYIDFTPVALRQRDLAALLARTYGAELHVLTVDAPAGLVAQLEDTPAKLARFVAPLQGEGIDVRPHYREGRPSDEILALVHAMQADLVLLGSHSKRGALDVGIGSTAAAVARLCEAAVVLVRPTLAEMERTRDLMVPSMPWVFPYP